MNNSNFRTRANTPTIGKSKVYISGSNKGIKLYLKKIEDSILSEFNCVVFNNYPEALNESQALVLIIERHILEEGDETADKEIKNAIENHVPIIPILLEEGLDEAFFNKFKRLEYLDFASQEKEDKNKKRLKVQLDKYILNDDMMQEVNDSFKSSIFLSYRKKDNKYARRFINNLHKDKGLQETSIWYDGFLEPGEDYSEQIDKKIAECDLFVISLTPYLLEPKNYVLEKEIPAALEKGKRIILVEMEEFDYSSNPVIKALENCPIVSISDTDKMRQLILSELSSIRPVDYSPSNKNRYLMGYGYLSGYSVEKNNKIALSFIEQAAKAGYLPAMEKLDNMYKDGNGVPNDIDLSLKWNEKYVDSIYKISRNIEEDKGEELLIWEVWKIVQRYLKYRKYREAAYYIDRLDPEKVEKADLKSAIYLLKGDLAIYYNDNERAIEFFSKSLKIRIERLKNAKSQDEIKLYNEQIGHCYNRLGDISRNEGDFQQALDFYSIALKNRKASMELASTSKVRRDYSVTLIRIVEVFLEANQASDALRYIEEALPIRISLNEEVQTIESEIDLAVSYSRYAKVNILLNKFIEAEASMKESLKIREKVLKVHETVESSIGLAATYYDLGEIYTLQEKLFDTAKCIVEGFKICEEEKWKENDEMKEMRAKFHQMNGFLLISWKLFQKAIEQFICAAEIRSELAQEKFLNGLDFRVELQNLGETYRLISTNISQKGKLPFLEKEKQVWKQLKQEYSKVEFYSQKYDEVLNIISEIR